MTAARRPGNGRCCSRCATTAASAVDRLRTIVCRYTAWHARHHVAARVSQYELYGLAAAHYEEIVQVRHLTNDVFREAVQFGIDGGAFAPLDVNRVVRGILSLSIDLVRWYRLEGADSPEQLGEFFADLALKMVMNTVPGESIALSASHPGHAAGRSRTAAGT